MAEALISVIVPVYNGASYLREAVGSVLTQSHRHLEVVVVNDGSKDSSGDIAEELRREDPRVRVVHQENQGLSAARNTGIEHATGDYLNFLDADDWLLPEKLQRQVAALEASPAHGLVYSDYVKRLGLQEFAVPRGVPPLPFQEMLVYRNWFAPMAPLLRRKLVHDVGLFDTSMRASEDRDYWYRCALRAAFLYLPGVLAAYRLHDGQMTKDRSRMNEGQQMFADKHLAQDPRRYRSYRTYRHMSEAKHAKATGQYLNCIGHIVRFALSANSLREARFVWKMPP